MLLLGTSDDHERNITFLQKHRFSPLRTNDLAHLDGLLNDEVCGIVVSRNWWSAVADNARQEVLRRLLLHSSFGWLKLDAENLPCATGDIAGLFLQERFTEPSAFEYCCHDGCHLTQHDMDCLERASNHLLASASVPLCPAEVHEREARVLVGAARKHVQGRSGAIRLTKVTTSILPGGRSGARVVRVAPDDGGMPLVAKIDTLDRLHDEMERFQRFIALWDEHLRPMLYFHAGTGLILFALVESPDQPERAAPTLEECLEEATLGELWEDRYTGPREDDLTVLLDRAINRLKRLNRQPCIESATRSLAWIDLSSVDGALKNGIGWGIADLEGSPMDVLAFRHNARRIVVQLSKHATVHGDVQLRNVLVRDARQPHFIDYAYSGPGHPCFDLVRLESCLLFQCLRMTEDEWAVAKMLKTILDGANEEWVLDEHPTLATSIVNRLAIRACVRCRKAALDVVSEYGGREDDYLAMKYIVACQSLVLPQTQKGIVRGALSAIGSFLRGRPDWVAAPRSGRDGLCEVEGVVEG